MFLATTPLIEFWDTDDEILLLGPWCLGYDRKSEWERLRYIMAPDLWMDPRSVESAGQYCGEVIETVLTGLSAYLNRVHSVRYSERYWRILLGPWLLYYVHTLYDRFLSLKQALASYPGLRSTVLSPLSYKTPVDTFDFTTLTYEETADLFNLQLYSQILRELGSQVTILKEAVPSCEKFNGVITRHRSQGWSPKCMARKLAMRVTRPLVLMARPKVLLGSLGLDYRSRLRLLVAMMSRGGALPAPQSTPYEVCGRDEIVRKDIGNIPVCDEFTAVLAQTLRTNFPLIYLEGYDKFRKSCLNAWPVPPSVLVSFDGWYTDETFKLLAAEYGERGARLVGGQHGEGYGMGKVIPQEKHEYAIVDRWYSFGWTDPQRGDKIKPLPRPVFLPLRFRNERPSKRPTQILLVAATQPRYVRRFALDSVMQFDVTLNWRSRFIRTLPQELRTHLVVRLHSVDYGWCQVQRLVEACPTLRFDDHRRSVRDLLRQCRLAVSEYHGTASLEMLAANIPTIFFWNHQEWEAREAANAYFESLRKVGLLWDSPESAAAKVTEVYQDPWLWWNGEAVQEARLNFVARHALGRKGWIKDWVKALGEEITLAQESDLHHE